MLDDVTRKQNADAVRDVFSGVGKVLAWSLICWLPVIWWFEDDDPNWQLYVWAVIMVAPLFIFGISCLVRVYRGIKR